jgi:hypothetical protein
VLVSYKGTRAKPNQAVHAASSIAATAAGHHVRRPSDSSARSDLENGLDMRPFYNLECAALLCSWSPKMDHSREPR